MSLIDSRHTLGDLLRRTARRHPNKPAIRCGQVEWTYAEFDTICNRLAAGLAEAGVSLGDRVSVLARNSHGFAALRFAVARLGAILVPINFMLNAQEVRFILQHSGSKTLCVDSGLTALGREASEGTDVERFVWLPSEDATTPESGMLCFDRLLELRIPANVTDDSGPS